MRATKSRFLRILVLLGMVLLPALSACGGETESVSVTASPEVSTPDTVSAEGVVLPIKKVELSFEGSGRVDRILVGEGDHVVAGQELAVLVTRDLEQAVAQAEAHLESAQAQLTKAHAGARPEEIAEAEAGLAIAQAASTAASEALAVAESEVTEAEANERAAKDGIAIAESQLASAQAAYEAARAAYNKLTSQPTERDVQIAEKQVELAKNQVWDTQLMQDVGQSQEGEAEMGEIGVQIAELNLEKVKAGARPEDIAEAKGLMEQTAANVKVAEARVARTRALATQAQMGRQAAESGLMQVKAQAVRAEAQTLQAQAQLDLASAGSRVEDIAAAEAQVKQAEASLAKAQNDLEDALLKAPFDGIVGEVLIDEGDIVAPQLVAMQFGDLQRLRVETRDLSEMDVARVQIGQPATIIVDALEGEEMPAIVASIAPLATTVRGDACYRVTLDLEPGSEADLRWGMSTLVEIDTGRYTSPTQDENALSVSGDGIVSAQAIIVPHKRADLSFKSSGRVQEILVSEGDLITAGQPLVQLETRNLEQIVLQAEAGLVQAQASLSKAQAGARPEEVSLAEAAVTIAEANARSAEAAVAVAEAKMAIAEAAATAAQAESDMAEAQMAVMKGALSAAQAKLDKATNGPTELDIQIAERQVDQAAAALNIIELIRPAARRYLLGALAENQVQVEIAQLQLAGVKAGTGAEDLAAAQAAVTQAVSDLQAARGQFSQAEAQESVAQAQLRTAEAQAAQTRAEVEVAKAQVRQAQAELSTLKAGSREEDIAAATADVAAATAALASAKNALGDATLKAVFDGTVAAIWVDQGELVQPADPVITLGDLSQLRADTEDLSEVDIGRIQVGQRAAVTVDALDGQVLPGSVSRISPVATERRGDTVYKISLDLDAQSSASLRWGMTAFVEIDTLSQPDASSDAVPEQISLMATAWADTSVIAGETASKYP
ncbi:MAG: HlyD family secretion protein [Anaerolineae bacterium]